MKQLNNWKLALTSLKAHVPAMLLYVLESRGSSPGRQGFFMVINALGEMQGSIGGGIMEHKLVELARQKLVSAKQSCAIYKQIHHKNAAQYQSGMICSGEQSIVLYTLKSGDLRAIERLCNCISQQQNGKLQLSPEGIAFYDESPEQDFFFDFQSEEHWVYEEKIGLKNKLFIVGGGHCSLALSELFVKMDFFITVFDDRQDLNTFSNNRYAHQKHLLNSYAELEDYIPSGENHYVVIMTFGYRTDDIALKALLGKNFKYMGVLGSKNKMETLFKQYLSDGIGSEQLHKIYTPAGLSIKSETPEEIAISIAAEIIKVKNLK